MKSSLRSSEETWPNCVFSYFLQLKMLPLREWGIRRSLCFSGAVMQSPSQEWLRAIAPWKDMRVFAFLDSGCLKSKYNMVPKLLFSSEMAYKMRNYNLKLYFKAVCWWEKNTLWGLILLKIQNLDKNWHGI